MHVYETKAYCFVCGYTCPSETVVGAEDLKKLKKEPTNIEEMMGYIDGLEEREIRGLSFKADDYGYYIVWPDRSFYKKRLFGGHSRYMGPSGHKPPILCFDSPTSKQVLILVEGEINAISLQASLGNTLTIASPGSATNMLDYLSFYLQFDTIYIIVDKDKPGVAWGWKLTQLLKQNKKKVFLEAVEKDFNQVLQEKGKDGVRELFKEKVGMLGGL